eukprot:1470695-Lingulodinium_polyedra.AAC.1
MSPPLPLSIPSIPYGKLPPGKPPFPGFVGPPKPPSLPPPGYGVTPGASNSSTPWTGPATASVAALPPPKTPRL